MEIRYARTWCNVPSDQFLQVGNTTILIPEGIFADIKDLFETLNKNLNRALVQSLPSLLN